MVVRRKPQKSVYKHRDVTLGFTSASGWKWWGALFGTMAALMLLSYVTKRRREPLEAFIPKPAEPPGPVVCAVIPARLNSFRLPKKLLHPIAGKPMLQHTFEAASRAKLVDAVYIAAENETLRDAALEFTPNVIMTRPDHINGMDRIGEAEALLPKSCQVLPHVHADAPLTNPEHIDLLVSRLQQHLKATPDSKVVAVTLRRKMRDEQEGRNLGLAKVVTRLDGRVLYISRALIPESKFGKWAVKGEEPYYINPNLWVMLRGYHTEFLETESTPLQLAEDIEYLKILESGHDILTVDVTSTGREVNRYEDYLFVKEFIEEEQGKKPEQDQLVRSKYAIPEQKEVMR